MADDDGLFKSERLVLFMDDEQAGLVPHLQ